MRSLSECGQGTTGRASLWKNNFEQSYVTEASGASSKNWRRQWPLWAGKELNTDLAIASKGNLSKMWQTPRGPLKRDC